MTESQVLKSVLKKLKFHQDVLWWSRLQAGRMGGFTLNPAGTPDIIAVINQCDGNIAILFLEVKKTGTIRLRYEQKIFFDLMKGMPKIYCEVINDPTQLPMIIRRCKNL